MHWYPTPHTWMHRNHHPSGKCTDILPLTHECTANRHSSCKCTGILPLTHESTEIIIPQVNAPESYPSQMNAPKIVTPQVNAQISWLSISHPSYMKNNAIIIPQVNKKERNLTPYTYMHWNHHPSSKCTNILPLIHECTANRHSSSKCTDILPLTHECTEIIIPQVNAPESYPSHMNAPTSSLQR